MFGSATTTRIKFDKSDYKMEPPGAKRLLSTNSEFTCYFSFETLKMLANHFSERESEKDNNFLGFLPNFLFIGLNEII